MLRFVSGILLLTLLTVPVSGKKDLINAQIYKAQSQIIAQLIKNSQNDTNEYSDINEDDISELMGNIDNKKREIRNKIVLKSEVDDKIEKSLLMKSATKTRMSEEQIDIYCKYNETNKLLSANVAEVMECVNEAMKNNDIQKEIMREDMDLSFVYNRLSGIYFMQDDALHQLNAIISTGEAVLSEL